jgi:hypothetical protein
MISYDFRAPHRLFPFETNDPQLLLHRSCLCMRDLLPCGSKLSEVLTPLIAYEKEWPQSQCLMFRLIRIVRFAEGDIIT